MTEKDNIHNYLLNTPICFGLKAQGHIPTIERMLLENKSWEEIGKVINWDVKTAKDHYELYKLSLNNEQNQ